MESIRQTQKKYGSRAMISAILAGLVLMVIGQGPVAKGLILGTLFSVLNFVLMGETLPLKIGVSKGRAYLTAFGLTLARYVLLAVPLIVAVKSDRYHIIGAVAGIFMIQIMIVTDPLFRAVAARRHRRVKS